MTKKNIQIIKNGLLCMKILGHKTIEPAKSRLKILHSVTFTRGEEALLSFTLQIYNEK